MADNASIISKFYTCFQNKDYAGMQQCYHPDARFNDSVFKNLTGTQAGLMWEMLIKSGRDMVVTFSDIQENPDGGSAKWLAVYTFSKTGRKVTNRISAHFEIANDLITAHTDTFDFYKWAQQAFGFTGLLLGWTPFFRKKVQATAMDNLQKYMAHR